MGLSATEYKILLAEIKNFCSWFLPSFFGAAVKIAYELRVNKVSWSLILTSLVIASFVGWVADAVCGYYELVKFRGVIIAVSAMGSDSLLKFFFKNDENIFKAVLFRVFNIKIESKDDGKAGS